MLNTFKLLSKNKVTPLGYGMTHPEITLSSHRHGKRSISHTEKADKGQEMFEQYNGEINTSA